MNEKTYNFRKLGATDLFPMCSIINKIGISNFSSYLGNESFSKAISTDEENAAAFGFSIMFEIASVVIAGLPKCENDIYTLLASVSDMTVKEIKSMGMAEFAEMVMEFITKEDFKDFFSVVSKFVK